MANCSLLFYSALIGQLKLTRVFFFFLNKQAEKYYQKHKGALKHTRSIQKGHQNRKRKKVEKYYKKCKGAPTHTRSIQKGYQNRKRKDTKTRGNLSPLTGTNPQNLKNNTSQQGLSCLSPARTKTPSIIINRAL
jgi:hypothetical protein